MSETRNLTGLNKAQLIEEIEQLRNSDAGAVIAELQDKVASLEEATKSGASTEEVDTLKAALAAKEDEVKQLQQMVQELTAENADLVADKGNPNPLASVDGARYKIKGSVRWNGKSYSPAMIAEDPAVCAHLVKIKSPILEPFN
jgi:chromosome segregation ATPase